VIDRLTAYIRVTATGFQYKMTLANVILVEFRRRPSYYAAHLTLPVITGYSHDDPMKDILMKIVAFIVLQFFKMSAL